MPTQAAPPTYDLSHFVELLRLLNEEGLEYLVIGGCAVGAYARSAGLTVLSADLDLYLSEVSLRELLRWAGSHGVVIEKRPQPRSVPVAVLRWRGLEINALTSSAGLPPVDTALRSCREFALHGADAIVYLIDPFDLVANKLEVKRAKDLPHIEVLRRYLEQEVLERFGAAQASRDRIAPARRFLNVFSLNAFPDSLASELVPLAKARPLRRFLASTIQGEGLKERLAAAAESDEERAELSKIYRSLERNCAR